MRVHKSQSDFPLPLQQRFTGTVASQDLTELMSEMRVLKTQMTQAADRIGVLEKRLRAAVSETAA